jgi:hypothetical protein
MAKVKPLQEAITRYAESALISAIRLRRYWKSQGLSEEEAIRKALKQAFGMLNSSGIPPKELYKLFDELEKVCGVFKKVFKDIISKEGRGK